MNLRSLVTASMLLSAGVVNATTTLEFITPDGVVGANDAIEVWVRLSSDTDFFFDASDPDGDGTYGNLDPSEIPEGGFVIDANNGDGAFVFFDDIFGANTNTGYSCSGSFSAGMGSPCPPGDNYAFDFNTGPGSFVFLDSYAIGAGESEDFLFGTFMPIAGGAAPGTYDFFGATFFIQFSGEGTDDFGVVHDITTFFEFTLGSTCSTGDTSCDFTRTVVPVPAAVWLFASALVGLTRVRRRTN